MSWICQLVSFWNQEVSLEEERGTRRGNCVGTQRGFRVCKLAMGSISSHRLGFSEDMYSNFVLMKEKIAYCV